MGLVKEGLEGAMATDFVKVASHPDVSGHRRRFGRDVSCGPRRGGSALAGEKVKREVRLVTSAATGWESDIVLPTGAVCGTMGKSVYRWSS